MNAIAIFCAFSLACASAHAGGLWRMYRCTGDEGETVFTDRKVGTDCVEIWLTEKPKTGWVITDPSANEAKKETDQ